jgi:hypothetical protein
LGLAQSGLRLSPSITMKSPRISITTGAVRVGSITAATTQVQTTTPDGAPCAPAVAVIGGGRVGSITATGRVTAATGAAQTPTAARRRRRLSYYRAAEGGRDAEALEAEGAGPVGGGRRMSLALYGGAMYGASEIARNGAGKESLETVLAKLRAERNVDPAALKHAEQQQHLHHQQTRAGRQRRQSYIFNADNMDLEGAVPPTPAAGGAGASGAFAAAAAAAAPAEGGEAGAAAVGSAPQQDAAGVPLLQSRASNSYSIWRSAGPSDLGGRLFKAGATVVRRAASSLWHAQAEDDATAAGTSTNHLNHQHSNPSGSILLTGGHVATAAAPVVQHAGSGRSGVFKQGSGVSDALVAAPQLGAYVSLQGAPPAAASASAGASAGVGTYGGGSAFAGSWAHQQRQLTGDLNLVAGGTGAEELLVLSEEEASVHCCVLLSYYISYYGTVMTHWLCKCGAGGVGTGECGSVRSGCGNRAGLGQGTDAGA